jgi:hypothetical protein
MSIKKFKDKYLKEKDTLTYSEQKKAKEEELVREEWELDEIDSVRGDDFVIATEKAREKTEKALQDDLLNFLDEDHNIVNYRERLAVVGEVKLKSIEFDKGWEYYCKSTDGKTKITIFGKSFDTKPGIVVILKDPQNRAYIGAIGVTYDPEIDHGALVTLVVQAENTYDKVRGYSLTDIQLPIGAQDYTKNDSGIYV